MLKSLYALTSPINFNCLPTLNVLPCPTFIYLKYVKLNKGPFTRPILNDIVAIYYTKSPVKRIAFS